MILHAAAQPSHDKAAASIPCKDFDVNAGRESANSFSILETIQALRERGIRLCYQDEERNRARNHICYISDMRKLRVHFPGGSIQYGLPAILDGILDKRAGRVGA